MELFVRSIAAYLIIAMIWSLFVHRYCTQTLNYRSHGLRTWAMLLLGGWIVVLVGIIVWELED